MALLVCSSCSPRSHGAACVSQGARVHGREPIANVDGRPMTRFGAGHNAASLDPDPAQEDGKTE
jgi:hypothetical protein